MGRKLAALALRAGLAFIIIELGAWAAYSVSRRQVFSYSEMWRRLEVASRVESHIPGSLRGPDESVRRGRMLTPFYGWAMKDVNGGHSFNSYGLSTPTGTTPILKRGSSKLNVLFLGGSVAQNCAGSVIQGLRRVFVDKEVEFVSAAIGGYKQPQQLYILSYLALMGAEFDIVINLDGFNEIYVAGRDNRIYGSNPFYPVYWKALAQVSPSIQTLKNGGVIALFESMDRALVQIVSLPVFRHSVFFLVAWEALHDIIMRHVTQRTIAIASGAQDLSGPDFDYSNNEYLVKELVRVWVDSSRQMANLSKIYGYQYFHFLQPNHFIHTKMLTKEEERLSLCATCEGEMSMSNLVQKAFPMMSASARILEDGGEFFTDLTPMFKDETRHIYADNTCHFTPDGNQRVTDRIVEVVAEKYRGAQVS